MPDPLASTSESELRTRFELALAPFYELDREIGRGGMGVVYRARDRRLKRTVAIKLLPPELAYRSEIRSRFLREAETAAQLNHPSIVPIYSVGEQDNLVFFVMACVSGDNLGKRLHDRGRIEAEEARRIIIEVGEALAYAHARNVIHRDIKPDNILLDAESGRAVVTDFGIARAVSDGGDSRLTATGMAIGTPAYMSPEQCAGDRDIDGRSDLYSLGIVAYQMLTGELPFSATNTPAMLVKHISEPPAPIEQKRADIPPDLARAVMMLLEKEPAGRFPNAASLVAALEGGPMPSLPRPASSPAPTARAAAPSTPPPPTPTATPGEYRPHPEEVRRWSAPVVEKFRRKLRFYGVIAPILAVVSIFSNADLFGIVIIWTIYMAYKYANLWSEGYDWRDVFRQPRDRLLIDVASETLDEVQGLLDRERRQELRERARTRLRTTREQQVALGDGAVPVADAAAQAGPHAGRVRQAALDRDEIVRLIEAMPAQERALIPEVVPSAEALYGRIESLAVGAAELERNVTPGALPMIEAEIARLEAEANPLDRAASEERVRRLAMLRRQRRAMADLTQRRDQAAAKLDSCAIALQNMRFDVLRLRAGAQSHQHVTSLAMEALNLAREVDNAVYAADQVARPAERGSGARYGTRSAPDRV